MFTSIRLTRSICLSLSMALASIAVLALAAFREVSADISDEANEGLSVPIVMYHGVVGDEADAGEYVITADELERDFEYILDSGYTPVFCSELADYVNGEGTLSDKSVVITFDDGGYGCFYYVLPLLERYKIKATFSIVGEWSMAAAEDAAPSAAYSTVDLDNLKTMYLSGYCELANHSFNMHYLISEGAQRDGMLQLDGESDEDYRRTLWNDLTEAQNYIAQSGAEPRVLAFPYGFCSDYTSQLVKALGFEVTLGCEEKINLITKGDSDCLYNLGRFNRSADANREQFFSNLFNQ